MNETSEVSRKTVLFIWWYVKLAKNRKDLLFLFVLLFGSLKINFCKLKLVELLLTSGFVNSGQQQIY